MNTENKDKNKGDKIKPESNIDPLLDPKNKKYSVRPERYPDIWDAYQKHQKAFWTENEIDYSADKKDWETLSNDEKYFIKNILAFFAQSDGIVNENISTNFKDQITIKEAQVFYTFQEAMEDIHNRTYNLLIDTYVSDPKEKEHLVNAIETIPSIKKKAEWMFKYIDEDKPFALRLLAFSIVEGVYFSGSFCAIFWLKDNGKMVGTLGKSNQFISRDEGLHTDFAILLYNNYIKNKADSSVFYAMLREAVEIETEFINSSIPCRLIGMNSDLMARYIKFVADRLSVQLGYEKIYNVDNPFTFMNTLSLDNKGNFFDMRETSYQLMENTELTYDENGCIEIDEDF